jgi:hypothetical protein
MNMSSEKMTPARWALTAFVVHLGLSFTFMPPSAMAAILSFPLRGILSRIGEPSGNEAEQAIQASTMYGLAIFLNSLFVALVVFVVLTLVRRRRGTV